MNEEVCKALYRILEARSVFDGDGPYFYSWQYEIDSETVKGWLRVNQIEQTFPLQGEVMRDGRIVRKGGL